MPTIEQLNYRHPEWTNKYSGASYWQRLRAMVEGGAALTDEHKKILLANPDNRPEPVIKERIKLSTYTNKIAPILTRTLSELFEKQSAISGSSDPFWQDEFLEFGALIDSDDDARASFHTFLREAMYQAFVEGKAIAQVDTRASSGQSTNKALQQKMGEDRPYVVLLPRTALWDWESDQNGFVFTKIHRLRMVRVRWDQPTEPEHDFTIYQRLDDGAIVVSRYIVRKSIEYIKKNVNPSFDLTGLKPEDVVITAYDANGTIPPIENQEVFNFKGKFEFPIITMKLSPALWIADQLYDLQKEAFNVKSGINYKLQTVNYSMKVLIGGDADESENPIQGKKFGDGYYLWLPRDFTIADLAGDTNGIAIAMRYIKESTDNDINNVMYQISLSAADGATALGRSGLSKKLDLRPQQLMLVTLGNYVKEFQLQILKVAAIARGEEVEWSIQGFDDYLGDGLESDITDNQGAIAANIPSPTFTEVVQTTFVDRYAKTYPIDQDVLETIKAEIKAAAQKPVEEIPSDLGGLV